MDTLARTNSIIPALGVMPPSSRSLHNSRRRAPPRSAATAETMESTHISTRISFVGILLFAIGQIVFSLELFCDLISFSDAECAEDQIEYVVGSSCSGNGIERPKGVVEIKQQHLVRNF